VTHDIVPLRPECLGYGFHFGGVGKTRFSRSVNIRNNQTIPFGPKSIQDGFSQSAVSPRTGTDRNFPI